MHPDDIAYNTPAAYRIRGPLDVSALERALGWVVDRHDVLRTRYETEGGEPRGRTVDRGGFRLAVTDAGSEARATALIREDIGQPFDLQRGPLFRATLHRLAADDHILAVVVHHSVFDGTSFGIWAAEVSAAYGAYRDGRMPTAAPVTQYAEYARQQRPEVTDALADRHLGYWRSALAGAPPVLELPVDRERPPKPSHRAGFVDFAFSDTAAVGLRELAADSGASLFMVTLAAYEVLVGRYTASRDIVVGIPVDARPTADLEQTIGFFVNSLPVRVDIGGDPTFAGLVARTRWAVLDSLSHRDVPFERIVEELAPPRDPSRNPVFQNWFDLTVQPPGGDAGVPVLVGADVRRFDAESVRTRFDTEMHLFAHPDGRLSGRYQYATDLFEPAGAARFVRHYRNVVEDFAVRPDARLSQVELFSAEELHTLVEVWGTAS
ncbi:Non-ribosomal peptide synthetase [Actinosynnema pretiosum subsp. pretiosum]|nr:Non-ribosomal peptide synthetase [Actinosynnema pretiosum subsp. pretiosum]